MCLCYKLSNYTNIPNNNVSPASRLGARRRERIQDMYRCGVIDGDIDG